MIREPAWHAFGGLDAQLFVLVNHAGHGAVWDRLALLGTVLGNHAAYPFYAAGALALALRSPAWLKTGAVLNFLVGYLIEWGLVGALKVALNAPRPLSVLGPQQVHVLGTPEYWHSFPSGHTAFMWLLLVALWGGANGVLRALLLVLALWVAWARIAVGAHFPVDVLAGALCGAFAAWLAARALALLGVRNG